MTREKVEAFTDRQQNGYLHPLERHFLPGPFVLQRTLFLI
jgi:hypothetical protein